MPNFFQDNEDLQFYVNQELSWDHLVKLVEPVLPTPDGPQNVAEAQEGYIDMMNVVGQFVAERIVPHVAKIDQQGLVLKDGKVTFPPELQSIMDQIAELGLHGMCLPRDLGGLNSPAMVYFIVSEMLARGDVSIMTHVGFHSAIATAMLLFSVDEGSATIDKTTAQVTKTRFDEEIKDIMTGAAWGCMDITEPNAGSDMAALTTKAELDENGQWWLTGQKIFITSGHGKYHFVIARSEPEAVEGLAGLSLFLVRTYEDLPNGERKHLATIDRLEEKLGHHGSATCSISFDRSAGVLVGKRGEGFKQMLLLMNNARLGVGFEALGLCESAYRMARDYAAERKSMGKTIDQHELIADYLDEMRTDIQGIRALAMYGAFNEETALRLKGLEGAIPEETELATKRRRRQQKIAASKSRRVTPLLKYLAAEKCVEMARRCLQIHGGVGYTKDYGAEKLLRDSLVTPIYEGTSQIQALMAMKDNLQHVMRNPQDFVKRVAQARWRSISARDPLERRVARMRGLSLAALQHLLSRTATDKIKGLTQVPVTTWPQAFTKNWDPKRDFAFAMLHAERLTRLLADAAICEILYDQARRHKERRDVLERYLDRAEPRSRFLYDEITTTGERMLSQLRPEEKRPEASTAKQRSA